MPYLNSRSLKLASSAAIAALTLTSPAARADFVIADDLIVQGSTCTGFDCVNGESFGFDTLRLKENNTRIQFNDTSVGSFPTNNWQVRANSSSNGGANFLAIVDQGASGESETGTIVFSVAAGAGANALLVNSSGNVGFGTGSPVVRLHAVNGNTPTLRLEQNGTSGFTAQTWDLAGNEANFFVRDATNGSTLPFRIRPGAATSTIDVSAGSKVGIGTASPSAKLTVQTDDQAALTVQGDGAKHIDLISNNALASQLRLISNSGNRNILAQTSAGTGAETRIAMQATRILLTGPNATTDQWLRVQASGIVTPGTVTSGGPTCGSGCDAVFDPAIYTVPSIEDHAALMWDNKFLPAVGPTRPGEPMNVTEKLGTMLNELEHAHIYIEQLHRRIEKLESALADDKG